MLLQGKPNDLVSRIQRTEFFQPIWSLLDDMLRPELYVSPCQCSRFRYIVETCHLWSFATAGIETGLTHRYSYIGRSIDIVEKYCGAGGPVEEKLAPYMKYIAETATAQLNV